MYLGSAEGKNSYDGTVLLNPQKMHHFFGLKNFTEIPPRLQFYHKFSS